MKGEPGYPKVIEVTESTEASASGTGLRRLVPQLSHTSQDDFLRAQGLSRLFLQGAINFIRSGKKQKQVPGSKSSKFPGILPVNCKMVVRIQHGHCRDLHVPQVKGYETPMWCGDPVVYPLLAYAVDCPYHVLEEIMTGPQSPRMR